MIASFNYELLTDQGYLANPYRKIRYLSPGQGEGFTLADQVYPDTRTSNAASIELKYYLPWRAAVTGQYRFFRDTWGIVAHTVEVDYTQPWRQLHLRRQPALLHAERTPTSTATCSRARTTRTSWRATASSPPSTASPSVSAGRTSSRTSPGRRG